MTNLPHLSFVQNLSIWRILLCSFLLLLSHSLLAQQKLTSDRFFQNRQAELNSLLGPTQAADKFKASWLNKIDFRTETDEFDVDRQQYLVRVSPSTGKIRKAQSQLHQEYLSEAALEKEKYRKSFIKKAYEDWLDIYEKHQRLSLERAILAVILDEQIVIQKLAAASLTATTEVAEIQQKINELKIDIYTYENELSLLYDSDEETDFSDLITLEAIRQKITIDTDLNQPLLDQEMVQKMSLVDAEMQLERAEGNQFFDFFQVQYNGPHREIWEEKLSVTLGFTIPFSSDRKLKMQGLKIEKESLQQEQQVAQTLQQKKITEQLNKIQFLFRKWDFIRSLNSESEQQAEGLAQKESAESVSTPLWQLSQKAEQLNNSSKQLDAKVAIYEAYIRLLDLSAILYIQPFTNHLR